jgi:hypothetical protein
MKKQVMLRWLVTLLVSVFIAMLGIRVNCQAEEATPQESVTSPHELVTSPQESFTSPQEPVTLTKRLSAGWNLISMEVSPAAFQDVEGMCKDINDQAGGCVEIDGWMGGGWSRYICGYLENDFAIQEGSFYFIKCEMPSEWKISGIVSQISSSALSAASQISASASGSESKGEGRSTSTAEGVEGVGLPYGSLLPQDTVLSGIPGSITPSLALLTTAQNECGWVKAGTNVRLLTSTDKVGIGTTAPNTKLHIYGGTDAGFGSGSGYLVIGNVTGSNMVMDDNEIIARNNGKEATLHFQADGGDVFVHQNQGAGTQFIIKDSGNVGIGTTSPSAKLMISGNLRLAGSGDGPGGSYINLVNTTPSTGRKWQIDSENGGTFHIDDITAAGAEPISHAGEINRLTINSIGNVGIGTISPAYKLDVNGDARASSFCLGSDCISSWPEGTLPSGSNYQMLRHDGTNWVTTSAIKADSANVGIGIDPSLFGPDAQMLTVWSTVSGKGGIRSFSDSEEGVFAQSTTGDGLRAHSVYGIGAMIEQGNPLETNSIMPTLYVSRGYYPMNGHDATAPVLRITDSTTGSGDLMMVEKKVGDSMQDVFRITDAGNVGIGTTSPTQRLDVTGTVVANGFALSRNNNNRYALWLANSNDFNHALYNNYSNLDGEGAWDGAKWNVFSGLNIRIGLGDSKTSALFVNSNGNVGIGTTTPSYKFHVIGDIAYTGNIYDVSDLRLKENITPLTNAIDKVSALRGIYFNLKGESPSKREVGVIAQEVEAVLPEVVSTDAQGYKSVDYSKLTPLLIEAVKGQQAQIESLKAENEAVVKELKAENKALKALVCQDHPEAEICQ